MTKKYNDRFKIKTGVKISLVLVAMILLTACMGSIPAAENTFLIKDYNISFTFPKDWSQVTKDTPYDLQCTNGDSYASIFTYYKIDLSEGQTPLDIYNLQKDDLFSKRENVKEVSGEEVIETDNKLIHSVLYSAENDGIKNYYYCNLIEFSEDAEVFAWVVFTAIPSYAVANMNTWKTITASAQQVE
jgi:hypothetical protein